MKMFIGWIAAVGVFFILRVALKFFNSSRLKKAGFLYVFVDEDKSVRKLTQKEINYLSREFKPNDPHYPFIKQSLKETSTEGKMAGYILVKKVPFWVKIN